ncbi:MAG: hypothetical protein WC358_08055 [Ignavibacteria bacterium]|jgi:hypothetical protein
MFGILERLRKKKINDTVKGLTDMEKLNREIEDKRNELRALISKAFPIGGLVGIHCQKEHPDYVVIGYLLIKRESPMIQVAKLNPRAPNAMTVSNVCYKDARFHGFATTLEIPVPEYEDP